MAETRLKVVYKRQLEIGKLKTEDKTFQWFRVSERLSCPSDGLGPYKFLHSQPKTFEFYQESILNTWDPSILPRWREEGLFIHGLFKWWFDSPLNTEIYREFDMYHHHLWEINGRKNIGWLRNMFFSVT